MRRIPGVLFWIIALVASLAAADRRGGEVEEVRVQDRCDPKTFPPEAGCIGNGDVAFEKFLEKLNPHDGGHGAWRFHMSGDHIEEGDILRVMNNGGEPHSFAEVSSFGTGVVPQLNAALPPGTPPAVPIGFGSIEEANGATLVLQNGTRDVQGLAPGHHKFQCLIHPWMRLEGDVRGKEA